MRGAHACGTAYTAEQGIIPAYAGSTRCRARIRASDRDHPRVCGEHASDPFQPNTSTGSSPRMRGALRHLCEVSRADGIIPAYAGSTPDETAIVANVWDHPRVCGEHRPSLMRFVITLGSSPRMRGAPFDIGSPLRRVRIIPAYAGSTSA